MRVTYWLFGETFFFSVRLVTDNIDLSVKARIQTKQHSNQSIHWTHQYAVRDRVPTNGNLEEHKPQCPLEDLELKKLLPTADVQNAFKDDCTVLVSRVITRFLSEFHYLKDTTIHHIPHAFSQEQREKSEVVSVFSNNNK